MRTFFCKVSGHIWLNSVAEIQIHKLKRFYKFWNTYLTTKSWLYTYEYTLIGGLFRN